MAVVVHCASAHSDLQFRAAHPRTALGNTFIQTGTSRHHCSSRRNAQRAGAAGAVALPSPLSWACSRRAASGVKAAAAAADAATAADSPAAGIFASLRQLQHSASSLDAEPTVEGLLTAFQQLILIQKQLQQESRQCKVTLFRLRRNARKPGQRVKPAGAASPEGTPAAADEAAEVAQAQLAALNQLRAAADDAQDFLLSLVQQLLQVIRLGAGCVVACSRCWTSTGLWVCSVSAHAASATRQPCTERNRAYMSLLITHFCRAINVYTSKCRLKTHTRCQTGCIPQQP